LNYLSSLFGIGNGEDSRGGEEGDSDEELPDNIMYADDAQIYHARRIELRTPTSQLQIPETVTVLQTKDGCTVYLVGTAHFSEISQKEVALVTPLLYIILFIVDNLIGAIDK